MNSADPLLQRILARIIVWIVLVGGVSLCVVQDSIERIVLGVAVIVVVSGLCFALGKYGGTDDRFVPRTDPTPQGTTITDKPCPKCGTRLLKTWMNLLQFTLKCPSCKDVLGVFDAILAENQPTQDTSTAYKPAASPPPSPEQPSPQRSPIPTQEPCPKCGTKMLKTRNGSLFTLKCPSCQHELSGDLIGRKKPKQDTSTAYTPTASPPPSPEQATSPPLPEQDTILSNRRCPKCGIRMLKFQDGFECPSCQPVAPPPPSPPPSPEQKSPKGTTVPTDKPCPKCGKMLRKPDRLVIAIKCPSCQHEWESAMWGGFAVLNCGKCSQRLRVPVDKGTLTIRCPKCKWEQTDWQPHSTMDILCDHINKHREGGDMQTPDEPGKPSYALFDINKDTSF